MDNHLLSHAIALATEAHKGQKDKYGQEYLHHPIRVMNMGRDLKEKIVGILHDVVEDTEWTCEDLKKEGFPDEIIEAVRCVTKLSDEEDYEEYIGRCATNPLAIAVKIHDLTDNMDVRRYALHRGKRNQQIKKISESLSPLDAFLYESLIIYAFVFHEIVTFAAGNRN